MLLKGLHMYMALEFWEMDDTYSKDRRSVIKFSEKLEHKGLLIVPFFPPQWVRQVFVFDPLGTLTVERCFRWCWESSELMVSVQASTLNRIQNHTRRSLTGVHRSTVCYGEKRGKHTNKQKQTIRNPSGHTHTPSGSCISPVHKEHCLWSVSPGSQLAIIQEEVQPQLPLLFPSHCAPFPPLLFQATALAWAKRKIVLAVSVCARKSTVQATHTSLSHLRSSYWFLLCDIKVTSPTLFWYVSLNSSLILFPYGRINISKWR